jgi:hypothetical protein
MTVSRCAATKSAMNLIFPPSFSLCASASLREAFY